MALSDCEKCWDTPCECGYQYKSWERKRLVEFIKTLKGVLKRKTKLKKNGKKRGNK